MEYGMVNPDYIMRPWSSNTVNYTFTVNGTDISTPFNQNYQTLTRLAMDQWEAVTDFNFIESTWLYSNISIGFDFNTSDGFGSTLGAYQWNDLNGNGILEPSVRDHAYLKMDPSDVDSFFSTMLHELGHAIGLDHIDDKPSIMATYANGIFAKATIQSIDIETVNSIYPSLDPVTPAGNPASPVVTDGMSGTDASDVLLGSASNDIAFGRRGADTIKGEAGDDVIYGNHNNDVIFGGEGSDKLFGGQNDGEMTGSPPAMRDGVEWLYGGSGDDFIYGNHGSDILSGGPGSDKIWGGQNDDTLIGNDGDDTLEGNLNNDVLSGGGGSDLLKGQAGNDVLDGGAGDDIAQFSGNKSDYTITQSSNTVVLDNRSNSPDGTDILNNVEFLKFRDQTFDISGQSGDTPPTDTDPTPEPDNDAPTGTDFNVAVNGSIGSPATATIENFSDGTDKIVLIGFGFTTSGSPSMMTSNGGSFGQDGVIVIDQDEVNNKVVIYLNGVGAADYAKVTVTGVTTLDLTDFEFS
jgi:Ca2+-binding RTX toxin-like protein